MDPIKDREKILVVSMNTAPFIMLDIKLLKKYYNVKYINFREKSPMFFIKNCVMMLLEIYKSEYTISWFINFYTLLIVLFCKLFNKKSIVIASGYSVANMPNIKYGNMQNPLMSVIVKSVLKNADEVICVSKYNRLEAKQWTNRNINVIYHCADSDYYKPSGKKENIILTVGTVSKSNLMRKGLLTFVKAAKYAPQLKFVIVGKYDEKVLTYLKSIFYGNVSFTGYLSESELLSYYQKAKVYVQISAHEAFGMSLAEAMLCECIPVVTKLGSIPELVGECGFYVPYNDAKKTAKVILQAMNSKKNKCARDRIKTLYPLWKRERDLYKTIKGLNKDG